MVGKKADNIIQHQYYRQFLEAKRIQPSMSSIGSSPDNAMMEFFFDILKSEMFYGYDKTSKSLNQLEQAIVDYIDYYNNKRIKVKLKVLSPVQYRTKSWKVNEKLDTELREFKNYIFQSLLETCNQDLNASFLYCNRSQCI